MLLSMRPFNKTKNVDFFSAHRKPRFFRIVDTTGCFLHREPTEVCASSTFFATDNINVTCVTTSIYCFS